jgi:hypothetical protein
MWRRCWIAGAGRAASQRDGMVAQQLEPAQRQQRHEVADVEAVGGRVKAAVERDGTEADALAFWTAPVLRRF